jgi:hypothetical protein
MEGFASSREMHDPIAGMGWKIQNRLLQWRETFISKIKKDLFIFQYFLISKNFGFFFFGVNQVKPMCVVVV